MTSRDPTNIYSTLAAMGEYFEPATVAEVNDHRVDVVKAKGEFIWHLHEDTDDTFLVIRGEITVQLRDRDVQLREGDIFVVPRGIEHRPIAQSEAHVLLFERAGTDGTGGPGVGRDVHQDAPS
jgi:mannose-6-phosphate isomerase-like protein (cupin superfamily)